MPDYYEVASIEYKMIRVEPGRYIKGGPTELLKRCELEHNVYVKEQEVIISKGFYMGETVVKQHQWFFIMQNCPWEARNVTEGRDYPATCVSWHDSQKFIDKLNKIEKSDKYRLPTDAEWEYACRAGSPQNIYYFGNDYRSLYKYAWYADDTTRIKNRYPEKVALKRPNAWGFYDMLGNVDEWCSDNMPKHPLDESYDFSTPVTDPVGPLSGRFKILRGGWYFENYKKIHCAKINFADPRQKASFIGFRLVRDL